MMCCSDTARDVGENSNYWKCR